MSIRDQSLQHWPSQIEKVKQLYNQLMVRHGVMLVGPTGGGKTTARGILQRALVLLPSIYLDENQSVDPVTGKPNLVVVSFSSICRIYDLFLHVTEWMLQ
jgi:ABC-type polar amino acid transport system ATPase subunit